MKKLKKIKIIPVAFESLGVRSMCTYVETPDVNILLDAGVSLSPNRFGLAPHPTEYEILKERRSLMISLSKKSSIVTISHYHFDHYTPSFTDWVGTWSSTETCKKIYDSKLVFAKNYRSKINPSQRKRGWLFHKTLKKPSYKLEFADGKSFNFGGTYLRFSNPVFHGKRKSALGWVLMLAIKYDREKLLYAPDIQGPIDENTLSAILSTKPSLAIIGGPPLYLVNYRVNPKNIFNAVNNLTVLAEKIPTIIIDHHILRSKEWRKEINQVFEKAADSGHKVVTAAEYLGQKENLLEAKRKELYNLHPPSKEYMSWTGIPLNSRRRIKPPLDTT